MNIVQSTAAYEAWLKRRIAIVAADLRAKHRAMEASPFLFLRATFYRWAQVWPRVCDTLASAPLVRAAGDLHLENFGTWRDSEGRLVWGINDFDECYPLPYTNDLVRLATSAVLAGRDGHLRISASRACDAILDGYRSSIAQRGRPIVLAERNRWLAAVAVKQLRDPREFWARLADNRTANSGAPRAALRAALPRGSSFRVVKRTAGAGSLGRPRFVALQVCAGGLVAREAKALVPSAAGWAAGDTSDRTYLREVAGAAVRAADPFFEIAGRWIIRRLAPDCTKIEVKDFPKVRDELRLLRAMGWETANVHLGSRTADLSRDLRKRRRGWLERAAHDMADATRRDFAKWKRR